MPVYGARWIQAELESEPVCLSEKVRSQTVGTDSPAETIRALFHTSETSVQKKLNVLELHRTLPDTAWWRARDDQTIYLS
jgi:hypothetical protein